MEISEGIKQLAKELGADKISLPFIKVANGILESIVPYLKENDYETVNLVVDDNTYEAAGKQIREQLIRSDIQTNVVHLKVNQHHQVIADEASVVQLLIETSPETDALIAVGAGTIHDITRFCGSKMNIPFISVPTAASVDGFTSKGAPLILHGVKQTIQTVSPIAVFADIDILKAAPREMTAAGFGDILAKYTSLLDWKISELIGDEPYNQLASEMTRRSLEACVENVTKIAKADDDGIRILIQSLIESGVVMLLLDFSRPASGSEHHLSHYWEMDLLQKDEKQILHGAKVGVATTIIADMYNHLFEKIKLTDSRYTDHLKEYWEEVISLIRQLPSPEEIRNLLRTVGGPATTEELKIDRELVVESINEAYHLRDRCTGMFLINYFKDRKLTYPLYSEGNRNEHRHEEYKSKRK